MTHSTAYTSYSRSSWRPHIPGPMDTQFSPAEAFLHHSEDSSGTVYDTLLKQERKVLAIQEFHIHERGWSDIGYHYVIFQPNRRHKRAHIFAARKVIYVPAAQLNHNSRTLAICVVGDGNVEDLHAHTRTAIRYLVHKYPTVKKLGGHRDVVATQCPGGRFYKHIPGQAAILGIGHY